MTTRFALIAAAALLAGCAGSGDSAYRAASLEQPDCYTVDPFKTPRIKKPSDKVPAAWRAFAGRWGGGAWDGFVCHDLYVMAVEPSGDVLLFDAHGPGFGTDATAFTRKGRIGPDGHLRVRKGAAMVEYWIEDGKLHGVRVKGNARNRIIMSRRELARRYVAATPKVVPTADPS
ncbi:hypothetical protein [Oceanicella actignis]|uniref:Lipoprotein n=2 Tax=Oceanicella actignis TaxID=1189325 RepID=A0A1M7SDX1_9RHOB|nr:hypothetical protein [Oceanicella actignis]TYO91361.1 hypothetical protein LY05_00212 [Oceanicella actignis]SET24190.1 hypothetical protein SAMN04488119_103227 [Oceanicella actignis]SHN56675.1 hypothetical protein SAMN05216200_102281 [Oceanicella actignis]